MKKLLALAAGLAVGIAVGTAMGFAFGFAGFSIGIGAILAGAAAGGAIKIIIEDDRRSAYAAPGLLFKGALLVIGLAAFLAMHTATMAEGYAKLAQTNPDLLFTLELEGVGTNFVSIATAIITRPWFAKQVFAKFDFLDFVFLVITLYATYSAAQPAGKESEKPVKIELHNSRYELTKEKVKRK